MLSHDCIEWMLERHPPRRLTVGQFVLKPNAHFTAWVWVIKATSLIRPRHFLFTSWLEELRGIYWEEHWAYNHEPLYCKLWDACLDDWIVSKKTDDNIYLKSIVSTRGKSMTDWKSKIRLNTRKPLNGCWQNTYNQSKDNSWENLGDGWFVQLLYDESSNTTLRSMVKLENQRE